MLKVTFEIIPHGFEDDPNRREIGNLEIGLEQIEEGNLGQYVSTLTTDGHTEPAISKVFIEDHSRELGAFELVRRCLEAHLLPETSQRERLFDGLPVKGRPPEPSCAACGNTKDLMGLEYDYTSPERYDGVSEWVCQCGARTGRWSGLILREGQAERRFGG